MSRCIYAIYRNVKHFTSMKHNTYNAYYICIVHVICTTTAIHNCIDMHEFTYIQRIAMRIHVHKFAGNRVLRSVAHHPSHIALDNDVLPVVKSMLNTRQMYNCHILIPTIYVC